VVAWVKAVDAFGDPLGVVLLAQGVVVDDGMPGGLGGQVVGQRGLAEEAVGVVGVAPKVVDFAAALLGEGHAVGGFGELEGLGVIGGVAGVGLEDFQGAVVLGLDPGHGARAGDVLEPEVFVGGVGGGCCGLLGPCG
jgi:hypothetical protein